MNPEEIEGLDPEVSRRAYYSQPPWKRIAVILAGPAVNIVIAFVLFWAVLFSGSLEGASGLFNLDPSTNAVHATTTVAAMSNAGTLPTACFAPEIRSSRSTGARRRSGRRSTGSRRIDAPAALTQGCRATTPVALTVRRSGTTLTLSVFPRYSAKQNAC